MFASFHLRSLFVAATALVLGVSASTASPIYIEDNGGFFSENAKATATREIVSLAQREKKELAIETVKELPPEVQQGVNPADKAAVSRVVEQWAHKQFQLKGINGVYILLVKTPAHLQIEVGTDTQKQAFTLRDRDSLASIMLARLRAKQNDEALLDGVNFVASTMRSNAPVGGHVNLLQPNVVHRVAEHRSFGGFLPIIIGFVVIWIVIRLIGALFRGGGGGVNPGGYGGGYGGGSMMSGGGGGGFFSSLIGGMFGAAAGNWMYDQFSGRRDSSSFDSAPDTRQVDDQGYTGKDTDSTGAGYDVNDNSGGGDSGSGDSGGGDFGGGDSGGGGDFGGGGDSGGGGDF